jgi:hypothetical protein
VFVTFGMGIGRYAASSDSEELRSTAVSGILGAGYELRVAPRALVIPYVSWLNAGGGHLRLNGALVTPRSGLSLLQYGIALARR